MMPMEPGRDGSPWELCLRCWLDGLQPTRVKVVTEERGTSWRPGAIGQPAKGHDYVATLTEQMTIEESDKKKRTRKRAAGR